MALVVDDDDDDEPVVVGRVFLWRTVRGMVRMTLSEVQKLQGQQGVLLYDRRRIICK